MFVAGTLYAVLKPVTAPGRGLRQGVPPVNPCCGPPPGSFSLVLGGCQPAINVLGSAALGGLVATQPAAKHRQRLLLGAGFCGGFTTFSTFAVDTVTLVHQGRLATVGHAGDNSAVSIWPTRGLPSQPRPCRVQAAGYLLCTNIGAMAGAAAGLAVARRANGML